MIAEKHIKKYVCVFEWKRIIVKWKQNEYVSVGESILLRFSWDGNWCFKNALVLSGQFKPCNPPHPAKARSRQLSQLSETAVISVLALLKKSYLK